MTDGSRRQERRDDSDGAEEAFIKILELDPSEATTLSNYGLLLHMVRDNATAAEDMYMRALALDPASLSDEERVGVLYNYAQLCESLLARPLQVRNSPCTLRAYFT